MTNPVRFSGAVHEVGHALVAHALSAPVGAMSVTDDGAGNTQIADRMLALTDRLTVCVGGMAAQNLMGCERGDLAWFSDLAKANTILNELGIAEDEHWSHIEAEISRTLAILKPQLNKIRAIAVELDAHGVLDATRVRVLLAGELAH